MKRIWVLALILAALGSFGCNSSTRPVKGSTYYVEQDNLTELGKEMFSLFIDEMKKAGSTPATRREDADFAIDQDKLYFYIEDRDANFLEKWRLPRNERIGFMQEVREEAAAFGKRLATRAAKADQSKPTP